MTIEKVRKLLAIAREKSSIYIRGEGAMCPVCAFLGLPFEKSLVVRTDGIVRYHKCGRCENSFKSIENNSYESGSFPETSDKKPIMKQDKSRKRRK